MSIDTNSRRLYAFESDVSILDWRAVNDNVMGGRSIGGATFARGGMLFAGYLDTRGGGFSSVRAPLPEEALKDSSLVTLRMRPDARRYELILQTDAMYEGRPVAYRAPIENLDAGQWCEGRVLFNDLQATAFGRPLPGPPFDPSRARLMGIILADGQDGQFTVQISEIRACRDIASISTGTW